jgi:hypothetical protein
MSTVWHCLGRAANLLVLLTFGLCVAWAGSARGSGPRAAVITPRQVEADWLRQEEVRYLPATPRNRPEASHAACTPQQDAAGGCDGMKNGTYGFHTDAQENPWWQVDLGESMPMDRVLIYNRCDAKMEDRAVRLKVLLSLDGKTWTELYRHSGSKFLGQPDGKPLVVPGAGAKARLVRVQLPEKQYLHLDEVEVYRVGSKENVALHKPADQSSVSQWSTAKIGAESGKPAPAKLVAESGSDAVDRMGTEPAYPVAAVVERGLKLGEDLRRLGANVESEVRTLREIAATVGPASPAFGQKQGETAGRAGPTASLPSPQPSPKGRGDSETASRRELYLRARWAVRRMALANPLLDFEDLLFVKRVPGTFTHMSDQNYGWFSRPGGGLFVLEKFKSDQAKLRCLSTALPEGSVLSPDISYDGRKVVFSHCKFYPGLRDHPNKLDKNNVPEDAFYHLYEINLDGTGLRRLTRGKYDDFDGRYLPSGEIVFLSTRRGQFIQCGKASGQEASDGALPDSYVRCGGGPERPVAVYTLHVMDSGGGNIRQISAFEMFEWTPSVDHEGRILYARWDYVDRWNMPFMKLWSTLPDGTSARAVFGNFTQNPHCTFEARAIPGSRKLIFTASGHHANTGGSLVLLDPTRGFDGDGPMTRLTPEVAFPETEGWPKTYFANPYPLSENHYLVAWSDREMIGWPGPPEPVNATGIYLFDAFGNLNLLYRDPAISSVAPVPVRPRPRPPVIPSQVAWDGEQEGRMLVLNVYEGLPGIPRGAIKRLRLVGIPVKTHPTMNYPAIGATHDDPGKFVIGSVPVEADGSAHFRVPSGVNFFLQALDEDGIALQTMRSATYVQPGQTTTCIGCHEPRGTSPPNVQAAASRREPSKIVPGPEGSWPFDYRSLVQPVLDSQCVACHKPGTDGAKWDLTADKSYETLLGYGRPSLRDHVMARYMAGRSIAGQGASQTSPLVKLLKQGHYDAKLDRGAWERFYLWMDTYGQRQGSFGPDQERRLRELRQSLAPMLGSRE